MLIVRAGPGRAWPENSNGYSGNGLARMGCVGGPNRLGFGLKQARLRRVSSPGPVGGGLRAEPMPKRAVPCRAMPSPCRTAGGLTGLGVFCTSTPALSSVILLFLKENLSSLLV